MKPTTEQISSIISDENIQTTLQGYISSNPTLKHGDIDIGEAVSKFNFICKTLKVTINTMLRNEAPINSIYSYTSVPLKLRRLKIK